MAETVIIIPNYNGKEHLETCLRSFSHQTYRDVEIVVVDNASKDDSVQFIRAVFPYVRIILQENNTGFAAAVNRGIRESTSEYVALVNNDIEAEPQWLERMVQALQKKPEIGAVACKMLNFYSRTVIDAAGDMLTWTGSAGARGHAEKDAGQYDTEDFVFGPCAGAALYRRKVFDDVGLFDESFFAFYEDVDLDFRMQTRGWKVLYVPSAVCYHKRGATMETMYSFAVKLHVRNHLFFLVKNIPARIGLSRFPVILASRLKNWFAYSRSGHFGTVLRGLGEALLKMPEMMSKRKTIQAQRTVSLEYIKSLMKRRH